MTAPTTWYELTWPREVTADQLRQFFSVLTTVSGAPFVLEAVSRPGLVTHRLGLVDRDLGGLLAQLRSALPGLGLVKASRTPLSLGRAWEVRLSSRTRALNTERSENTARAILAALAQVGAGESLVLQWVFGRSLVPTTIARNSATSKETVAGAVVSELFTPEALLDADERRALRLKRGEHGWRVLGRLGVDADTGSRQHQLLARLLGALRSAEAPGVRFTSRPLLRRGLSAGSHSWRYPLRLNLSELVAVAGLPIGITASLPVHSTGSTPLAPTKVIPSSGRVIGDATFPGRERPLALNAADARLHTHVLGPTGTGKSTLLINLIMQDAGAGRGLLVLDVKGDLITDTLRAWPADRRDDLVIIDPTSDAPVGINPLAPAGRSPELVADQLLSVFHGLYAAHWGPRTQDILHAGLLTLAQVPGSTLAALPLLLSDAQFRRRMVRNLDDPVALGPFWSSFERWSEAERAAATAPVANKLRPFLRPQLRAIIGQKKPRFSLTQIFTERKAVLVNLAKGLVGPEAAALLGALILAQFWQATLGRAAVPLERRHPVFVYLDEFADYLHLGTDLADALGQARGMGVGLILAHQHLHQLEPAMRSAVISNARSRICFQLAPEDARVMTQASMQPAPEDFTSLGAYECYLQLVAKSAVQPWCSARTRPAPSATGMEQTLQASSTERFGVSRATTEADLRALVLDTATSDGSDLAPRRRRANGGAL
ncbi:MAG: type IV secretion system DNA-binding domain-containing protein [Acidimicrobiales bacterium]